MFSLVRSGQPKSVQPIGSMKSTTYARTKGNVHFVWFFFRAARGASLCRLHARRATGPGAIEAEGKVVWGLDVARFGNDRTALGRRWHTSQPCPACHAVSGGTRICWPGDFAAWWRTKLKRKLGKTEQIKKIRVGWGYRSRTQVCLIDSLDSFV